MDYDVMVIGGGAAGLSGALALARARRSVLVVDAGEPRNAPAGHVHNYLGREGTPPAELYAVGRDEVAAYGGEFRQGTVVGTARTDGGFAVRLADGAELTARRLLLATGAVDELPAVPGLAERWGSTVLHCPYCHGWEVRDRPVGIIAVGPTAVHQALLWRQWTADLVLFLNDELKLSEEEREQFDARGVRVVEGRVAAVSDGGVELENGTVVAREAVVVMSTLRLRSELIDALGVATAELEMMGQLVARYVTADATTGLTSVPGVYAAGNVVNPMAQVIIAAGAGLMAGSVINADLMTEETAAAVAARRA